MPKISELPTVTAVTRATDKLVGVVSGVTSQFTPDTLGLFERGHANVSGGTRVGVPGAVISSQSTLSPTADSLYYAPFLVSDAITVDACLCEVTTNAGTIARMGILSADTAWQPTAVIQDAGTVDPSTTGVKTASFTAITLAPGRYLTVLVCNGAAAFRTGVGGVPMSPISPSFGAGNLILGRYVKAGVGTGALGTTAYDSMPGGGTGPHLHMVFLRITAV